METIQLTDLPLREWLPAMAWELEQAWLAHFEEERRLYADRDTLKEIQHWLREVEDAETVLKSEELLDCWHETYLEAFKVICGKWKYPISARRLRTISKLFKVISEHAKTIVSGNDSWEARLKSLEGVSSLHIEDQIIDIIEEE
jgi:hypothetical protein